MKTIIFTVICFSLLSCDPEVQKDTNSSRAEERNSWNRLRWQICCTVGAHPWQIWTNEDWFNQNMQLQFSVPGLFFGDDVISDWRTVDRLLSAKLSQINQWYWSEDQKELSYSIQYAVLKYLDRYLNKEPPSKVTAKLTEKYLRILVKHKAIDLNVMAEGLVCNKEYIPEASYQYLRDYIYNTAVEQNEYVKNNIQEAIDDLNDTLRSEHRWHYLSWVKKMEQTSHEAVYVIELLQ